MQLERTRAGDEGEAVDAGEPEWLRGEEEGGKGSSEADTNEEQHLG